MQRAFGTATPRRAGTAGAGSSGTAGLTPTATLDTPPRSPTGCLRRSWRFGTGSNTGKTHTKLSMVFRSCRLTRKELESPAATTLRSAATTLRLPQIFVCAALLASISLHMWTWRLHIGGARKQQATETLPAFRHAPPPTRPDSPPPL